MKLRSAMIFGGVGFNPQVAEIRRGVDIVVATPGRLLDHHQQRNIDLSKIEILVLDEGDRMLDMGFIPDVKRIIALVPKQRQTLLFSATFSDEIPRLAGSILTQPRTIEVAPRNSTVESIAQRIHPVDRDRNAQMLSFLIGHNRWKQVLVFARTKHGADKLVHSLERDGIGAVALHGNKSQGARTKALADFKKGVVEVMVATDIAARGIDIDQLPHVVNYDLPNVPEDYVHRIGRTGRAGADGEAISLVCVDEHTFLRDIERLIKRTIVKEVVAGFEPDPNARAQPVFAQRGRGPRQHTPAAHARGKGRDEQRPHTSFNARNGNVHEARRHTPDERRDHGHSRAQPGARPASTHAPSTRGPGGDRRGTGKPGSAYRGRG
jgi:ATP-dependent RNA helicase RhlE